MPEKIERNSRVPQRIENSERNMGHESTSTLSSDDVTIYIVVDRNERRFFYTEADEHDARKQSVIENILAGRYSDPVRVVAFNLVQGWARDVTREIATAVLSRARAEHRKLSPSAESFLERVLGQNASMRAR